MRAGVLTQIPMLSVSGATWRQQMLPLWGAQSNVYTVGSVNLWGAVSWLAMAAMLGLSLACVRRARFRAFYIAHVVLWPLVRRGPLSFLCMQQHPAPS